MNRVRGQKGFTLIEVILVIIMAGILAAALSAIFLPTTKSALTVNLQKEALAEGRAALNRMVREIRSIRSTGDIATFTATDLQFTDVSAVPIQFTLVGTDLQRNGDVLAENVAALTFTYLQSDGATPAAAAAQIWTIRVNLQMNAGGEVVNLQSEVHPLNL